MFFIVSKVLGFFAIPSNLVIVGRHRSACCCLRRALRAPAGGSWSRASSLLAVLGFSPIGNRADHSARAALPAVGRRARRAGRHRRAGRGDLARRLDGAQRCRAQRGGRAHDRAGGLGAALSAGAHRVSAAAARRCSSARRRRRNSRSRLCETFGIAARAHPGRGRSRATPSRTRCSPSRLRNRSRASAGCW